MALRNIRIHSASLNGLVNFLIIGDPRGDSLMLGSMLRKMLTELEIPAEDAECN